MRSGGQTRPQGLSLKNHPFFEGKSPGDEVGYTPTKNSRPSHFLRERPWGLGWGCTVRWWLVLQILALFQTKKCHFAQQFSDLAPCFHRQKLCHHQSNAFKRTFSHITLSFPLIWDKGEWALSCLGMKGQIRSRSSLKNHPRFQTKMGKVDCF